MLKIILPATILVLALLGCRKDSFISSPDASVVITADTLRFDTLFVSSGSTYRSFRIKNDNDQKLRISSIRLMGNNSAYRLNVDGIPGPRVNEIDIEANDSVHVFVQVNVDPSAGNLPFIVRDSLEISYNGVRRIVQLEAWGQNAHFLRDHIITAAETWNNDLPYVILGFLFVDTNAVLTINRGCRVYVHGNAPLVVAGTLRVNGMRDTADRVIFRSDRLDEPYSDLPAGWPGIFFTGSSKDNVLQYTVIRNAYQAIALTDPPPSANPKLQLNECVIDNAYDAGIVAVNSSIRAQNCLVTNCGRNIILVKGGNYQFTHCTVASYGNNFLPHREPVLLLSNFVNVNNSPVAADLNAVFRNCIFWGQNGTVENEVVVLKNGNTAFNVSFDHPLWKLVTAPANATVINALNNQDPLFDSINVSRNYYNFRLKPGSPAINRGVSTSVVIDLDGKTRPVGLPDLGCFEFR